MIQIKCDVCKSVLTFQSSKDVFPSNHIREYFSNGKYYNICSTCASPIIKGMADLQKIYYASLETMIKNYVEEKIHEEKP
jgi:hypothetical protein